MRAKLTVTRSFDFLPVSFAFGYHRSSSAVLHPGKSNEYSAYPAILRWCVQVIRSPKEAFAAAMQSWRERCEKCLCLQGDYVEKLLHFQLPVVSSFLKIN